MRLSVYVAAVLLTSCMQPTAAINAEPETVAPEVEAPIEESEPVAEADPIAEAESEPSPYIAGMVYLVDAHDAIVYSDNATAQMVRAYRDMAAMWNRQQYGDYLYKVVNP